MSTIPTTTEMRRAFYQRDASYDGVFFVGVRTTGVYCRPSCPARKPVDRNVEYFSSWDTAESAGYRACKRCRPLEVNGHQPDWLGRVLSEMERLPGVRITDRRLRAMSIDPARARRYFKKTFGMTFQTFHRSKRLGLALSKLRHGEKLDAAADDIGYESNSGFRDAFEKLFGEPPGRGRNARCAVVRWIESPVGPLMAGALPDGLCALEFIGERPFEMQVAQLRRQLRCAVVPGSNKHIGKIAVELDRYFAGKLKEFTVPLAIHGTDFQKSVWKRLLKIPYGETISYDQLAADVKRPLGRRAVGQANGSNLIAIVIPCHRVIRKDGTIGGYGGGLWRKKHLLDLEDRVVQRGVNRNRQGVKSSHRDSTRAVRKAG